MIVAFFTHAVSFAQTTYTWQGADGASWAVSTNWTPTRTTPAANDILQFNAGNTRTITAMPTQTVGRLLILNNTTITLQAAAANTLTIGNGTGTDLDVASGSALTMGTNVNITLATNATAAIAGTLNINAGRTYNTNGTTVVTTVTGTLNNAGTVTNTTASKLLFQSGSLYQHNQNAGTIALATWNANSTMEVNGWGAATTSPGNITQNYGNVLWNSSGQTGALSLAGALNIINGNFTVTNTGSGSLSLGGTGAGNLSIAGSFSQTGGTFIGSTSAARTMTVAQNFSLSGGTFNLSSSTTGGNAVTVSVGGNFSHTAGTLTESGSTTGSGIIFTTGNHTYTSGGTLSNTVNYTVNNGAVLQMGTGASPAIISSGSNGVFTLAAGATLGITSPVGVTTTGATGNIQLTGTRTYTAGSNFLYNGTSAQVTGNGLTSTDKANLTIDNPTSVTLSAATTITGNLLISQGTLSVSGSNFALNVGGNWTNNGTFTAGTGTVTFTGTTAQSISGSTSTAFSSLAISKTAQTLTVNTTTSAASVTYTASGATLSVSTGNTLNVSGAITLNSAAGSSVTGTIAGAGTINAASVSVGSVVTPSSTATTVLTSTSSNFNISGNLTIRSNRPGGTANNATFTQTSGTITLGGVVTPVTGNNAASIATISMGNSSPTLLVSAGTPFGATGNAGVFTTTLSGTGATVNYTAAAQTVRATVYTNLILSGSGTKTTTGITVNGTLSRQGTASLSAAPTYGVSATLEYKGSAAQVAGVEFLATTPNVRIDNSNGVTLSAARTITTSLEFVSGILTLSTFDLTIGASGSIAGATSSNYVRTNSTGRLIRTLATSVNVLFPVGNSAYNPITLNNSGTTDVYRINLIDGAVPAVVNNDFVVQRRWQISEAVAGGSNLSVVAQYNSGEEGISFNTGSTEFIGFYNGTLWTQSVASQAGSDPFTFTSGTNFTPANITTGTQYIALGKDEGLKLRATKLVITAITPTSPTQGVGFDVTVQAQNADNLATLVVSNTFFSLSTNGNAGAISGTTTGVIVEGENTFTVTGVILPNTGTGVTITATRTFGDNLTAGTSATFTVVGPATGDYRSAGTGTWSTLGTWQRWNGSAWATPTGGQGVPNSGSGNIQIRSPHVVTISTSTNADQMIIEDGGGIIVNNVTFTIANGAGTDLTVRGEVVLQGTSGVITPTGTIVFQSGGLYQHSRSTGTVPTATWDVNSICVITGSTNALPGGLNQTFGNFSWASSVQGSNLNLENSIGTVAGSFTVSNTNGQTLRLSNTATGRTFNIGRDFNMIGGNFTIVNSTGTGTVNVGRDFYITGGTLNVKNGDGAAELNITGEFSQTGGTLNYRPASTASTAIITVGSNYSMTAGTTNMSAVGAVGTLNVAGNFSVTGGTITESSSGSGLINFNGTGNQQDYTSGATISNTINFNVNANAYLQMVAAGTQVQGGGSFTTSTGSTLGIRATDGISTSGATGNIRVTGTRTFNTANYIYNGSAAQITGTGLPATVNDLVINNSAGVTQTNANLTINGEFDLTAGVFTSSTNLTVAATGNIINFSSTSYVNGKLNRVYGDVGSKDFPIGKGGNYRPLVLQYTALTGTSTVSAEQFEDALTGSLPSGITLYTARRWVLSQTGGSSFEFNLTLFGSGFVPNGDPVILKKDGTIDDFNASFTSPNFYTANGFTGFGEFALGSRCVAPVINTPSITNATCNGDTDGSINITLTGGSAPFTYLWSNSATTQNISGLAAGTYSVTVTATGGCFVVSNDFEITEPDAVLPPVSGGDEIVCFNGDPLQTLIATATSANDIVWYDAASGGVEIPVPFQIGVGAVTYYAEAVNGACSSDTRTAVLIEIQALLPTPGLISGPLDVCPHTDTNVPITYSIDPVSGAESYTWTVPNGATIVNGQGTTSIDVLIDNSFSLTNSRFRVVAESSTACTSEESVLEVLKVIPGIPTVINGPFNVCSFVNQPTNAVYSIDPVANAISYAWTVPPGATIQSGQGTTSIEVSFDGTFTSGSIKVAAEANCGTRAPRSYSITRQIPSSPSVINGPVDACPFIGTPTEATYSIDPVVNADSYFWTVPANVTLVSGQGTTSINVTFNTGYVTAPIKVRSVSNCGNSGDRSLSVVASTYGTPRTITGPTNACAFIGLPEEATYSIRKVTNAASYIWSVPTGATITSHPAGLGANDTIITVSFDNSFVSGTAISVRADGCVPSAPSNLTINKVLPSTPGPIAGNRNACPFMVSAENPVGIPVTYTINKVANAISYNWVAPANATITAHPAGLGVNDTIVEVTYSAAFTSGTLSVTSQNNCGTSVSTRTLAINKLTPGAPGAVDVIQLQSCPTRQYSYTLAGMPTNATYITWTVPASGTINSGQGTTSITVTYASGPIAGTVTATPRNNCAVGSTRVLNVKIAACPPEFAGNTPVFQSKGLTTEDAPLESVSVTVTPNPTVHEFVLQSKTNNREMIRMRVIDMTGRELMRMQTQPGQQLNFGKDLKAGSYMLEIIQGETRTIQKIMKL